MQCHGSTEYVMLLKFGKILCKKKQQMPFKKNLKAYQSWQ